MNELLTNIPFAILIITLGYYLISSLFIIYHLLKFGLDYKTKILAAVFLAGSTLLIFLSFYLFFKVEWTEFIYEYLPFPEII